MFPHFLFRWKSFKLWLISGTNAVYSCKKAGFTLMCKDLDSDEEGAWKRYKEKILSKCLGNSTWLSSIANWFSFFEWSFLLNCVISFWASNAKLTEVFFYISGAREKNSRWTVSPTPHGFLKWNFNARSVRARSVMEVRNRSERESDLLPFHVSQLKVKVLQWQNFIFSLM